MSSAEHLESLDAAVRSDLRLFVDKTFAYLHPGQDIDDNWHLDAIVHKLEQVRLGKIRRLLITMPPRALKSIITSVAFPAYLLGRDPSVQVACVSYGEELGAQLASNCRDVMTSEWYRRACPGARLVREAEHNLCTAAHGCRRTTTINGPFTGLGCDVLIVDDPIKAQDVFSAPRREAVNSWVRCVASTRLNDKRSGAIIVVMQRLHEDDLAANLIASGGWDHLNLPAINDEDREIEIGGGRVHRWAKGELLQPVREPLEVLEQLRRDMGEYAFSAQYLQRPIPAAGNLVKREWLRTYDVLPPREPGDRCIQAWDFAVSASPGADYTAAITALVKGNSVYVIDVFRARIDYPQQRAALERLWKKFRPEEIYVEDAANGTPHLADLRARPLPGVPTPIGVRPKGDKIQRLHVHSSRIQAGDLLLPVLAPWKAAFIDELMAFPYAKHDDQVDALSLLMASSAPRTCAPPISANATKCFDGSEAEEFIDSTPSEMGVMSKCFSGEWDL
jgi:predicted phage terminase large subunit-like protein